MFTTKSWYWQQFRIKSEQESIKCIDGEEISPILLFAHSGRLVDDMPITTPFTSLSHFNAAPPEQQSTGLFHVDFIVHTGDFSYWKESTEDDLIRCKSGGKRGEPEIIVIWRKVPVPGRSSHCCPICTYGKFRANSRPM